MAKQNYSNHVRVYPLHHLVFYPVILFLLVLSIRNAVHEDSWSSVWVVVAALCFVIAWLSFMTRQHYALTLQNRIVQLEMRLRYFQLTTKRFEPLEATLGFGRIAALRFAPDEELIPLIEKTLSQNLSAKEIKKSIRNWHADHSRV